MGVDSFLELSIFVFVEVQLLGWLIIGPIIFGFEGDGALACLQRWAIPLQVN